MTKFEDILKCIIVDDLKLVSLDILDDMIENIGSTDPILRDKLIYTAFGTLIIKDHLNKQQLEYILKKLLENELLVKNIEQSSSDFVFTRSFTSLVYAAILEYDSSKQVVDEDLVRKVIDTTHDYMTRENDLRGHVARKGWAHAVAHGADLLDSVIKHPLATEHDARKVLQHIARFITIANGYQDDEEERLSYSFVTLTKHQLQETEITNWLLELHQFLVYKEAKADGALQPYYANLAFKNFLKSTYFLLEKEAIQKDLKETIKQLVLKLLY
ncbi:DUF2785 domain-containing protein [Psychrobacillus lasiicapitis]|uniref:DUF2785 domain-containing protein n=1 Tax=Psychrobacillus lasiicapitis TaxID=1636719 RepID=A0A544TCD3_9BACI|nr:DUF2785 domain-containing protein [Psychrobacillus lasiicapitis]TQR15108.1 DUF2785 domain-containing protein [Psychrobacillus lasiicapitis]GGA22524.1 membrane protein [Psychrobacillus lasiicapitis]